MLEKRKQMNCELEGMLVNVNYSNIARNALYLWKWQIDTCYHVGSHHRITERLLQKVTLDAWFFFLGNSAVDPSWTNVWQPIGLMEVPTSERFSAIRILFKPSRQPCCFEGFMHDLNVLLPVLDSELESGGMRGNMQPCYFEGFMHDLNVVLPILDLELESAGKRGSSSCAS